MIRFFEKIFKYTFVMMILLGAFQVIASSTDGLIDTNNHSALLCMDNSCTTTTSINFRTTNGREVHITDDKMTGDVWSEEMGWINLDPTTSGVKNDGDGNLSGYAWGENAGWINFNPTNGGVSINSTGEFLGYAWAQNFGWIKFDCATSGACVKTDWEKSTSGGGNTSGGSTTGGGEIIVEPEVDVCPNIYGTQTSVPAGLVLNDSGNCVVAPVVLDFCEQNPTDPSCVSVVPDFCTENPSDPSCQQVEPTFCELNPSDSSCQNVDFCTLYPSDPSCITTAPTIPGCVGPDCEVGAGDGDDTVLGDTTLGDLLNEIQDGVSGILEKSSKGVSRAVSITKDVFADPVGKATAEVTSTVGVVTGLYLGIANAFTGPLTLSELFLTPMRLWNLLLVAFGIRKRRAPWGTVYDSVTKQPLDPAYVVLQDLNGNEVATSITDLDGRYGFLVPKGQYRIIANKTNYEFPSKKLAGRVKDELYEDLYFNEIIDIKEDGEVITKNIPLDPVKFDWNEFAKRDKKLMKFFSRKQIWIARVTDALFILGFLISIIANLVSPGIYNIAVLVIYVLMYILKKTILKPRAFGHVKEKISSNPLSFAILRIFFAGSDHEVIHKVADKTGRYYCLIPNGTYYAKIESKNLDESYSVIHTSEPIEVKKGYINKRFEI